MAPSNLLTEKNAWKKNFIIIFFHHNFNRLQFFLDNIAWKNRLFTHCLSSICSAAPFLCPTNRFWVSWTKFFKCFQILSLELLLMTLNLMTVHSLLLQHTTLTHNKHGPYNKIQDLLFKYHVMYILQPPFTPAVPPFCCVYIKPWKTLCLI